MASADDYNTGTIDEFRANRGQVGGRFRGAPLLLLHTVGARSGEARVNPMMYLPDGGRYVVFASKGGSDTSPAWYHNLLANPDVVVEVGDQTLHVHADEMRGTERDDLFSRQASLYPGFARYQSRTARTIPVIALTPTARADPSIP